MGENSVTISPSVTGIGSGVLGLGAGYILAPQKYSLERVLMQDDDSFSRNFSDTVMKKATDGEKKSLTNLHDAAHSYHTSGDVILKEKIVPNAKLWHEMVAKVNVEDKFVSEVERTKKNYLQALKDTNYKQLKQNLPQKDLKNIMSIWNEQLADCMQKIKMYRANFVAQLSPYAQKAHEFITDGKENLSIEYVTISEDNKEDMIKKLESCLEKDVSLGYTTYGVHRDDLKVAINDVDVRTYGSQGQQRTASLSLKLAELNIIEDITHTRPVLLLDDVLSELDENRKKRLLNYCKGTQTFITCTSFAFDVPCKKIEVKNGSVL